jgi:hypothetical protein
VFVLFIDVLEADRAAACILVDKWDKVPREVLHEEMRKILPDLSAEKISQLLDTINVSINNLFALLK